MESRYRAQGHPTMLYFSLGLLAYLDTTGAWGVLARETLVADAVRRIAAAPKRTTNDDHGLDGRQALTYMREVLDDAAGTARDCIDGFPRMVSVQRDTEP